MVLANVAMGEHVVAEPLRVAQARAMAEHQPGMGPQHGNMVGDVARVGRTGADVDQGDAAIAGRDQVEGWHLRPTRGRNARRRAAAARDHIAWSDEGIKAGLASLKPLLAELRE